MRISFYCPSDMQFFFALLICVKQCMEEGKALCWKSLPNQVPSLLTWHVMHATPKSYQSRNERILIQIHMALVVYDIYLHCHWKDPMTKAVCVVVSLTSLWFFYYEKTTHICTAVSFLLFHTQCLWYQISGAMVTIIYQNAVTILNLFL